MSNPVTPPPNNSPLNFITLRRSELGQPFGVAQLDSNGKIILSQIPGSTTGFQIVNTILERDSLPNKYNGMVVYVMATFSSYIWNGAWFPNSTNIVIGNQADFLAAFNQAIS